MLLKFLLLCFQNNSVFTFFFSLQALRLESQRIPPLFRVAGVAYLSGFCYDFFAVGVQPDLQGLPAYLPCWLVECDGALFVGFLRRPGWSGMLLSGF